MCIGVRLKDAAHESPLAATLRCAALCLQSAGLVPIVEPEVTLGPGAYTIEETAYWSEVRHPVCTFSVITRAEL